MNPVIKSLREPNYYIFCIITVDFVLDGKGVPLLDAYDKWRAWADEKVCCDYGLHVAVTWWGPNTASEMETLVKEKGQSVQLS